MPSEKRIVSIVGDSLPVLDILKAARLFKGMQVGRSVSMGIVGVRVLH